jgi:hypothetical protein
MDLIEAVKKSHATINTKQHCVYMYFFLGLSSRNWPPYLTKLSLQLGNWSRDTKMEWNLEERRDKWFICDMGLKRGNGW